MPNKKSEVDFSASLFCFREPLIKSDVQITPSDFSSDCAKTAQESRRISTVFVRYDGKYASKLCIKAYAVIYSEVP